MNITKMQAALFCIHCNRDTIHDVIYLGERIERISCLKCDAILEINEQLILSTYAADIFKRINTKPKRMSKEMKEGLSKFLYSIPIRIVTKPYRMIKEFKIIKNMAKEN